MLAEAQSELILGHWWQLAAATLFMAIFVTAFSLMTDALRDALDPKLRGSNERRPMTGARCSRVARPARRASASAATARAHVEARRPRHARRQLRRAREHHRRAGRRIGLGQERDARCRSCSLLPDNAERTRRDRFPGRATCCSARARAAGAARARHRLRVPGSDELAQPGVQRRRADRRAAAQASRHGRAEARCARRGTARRGRHARAAAAAAAPIRTSSPAASSSA